MKGEQTVKTWWTLTKEAARYKAMYAAAILSTFLLTAVNLTAPKVLSSMTGIVEQGVDEENRKIIGMLAFVLLALYCVRVLFRFCSSYPAHKAAWNLVGDLRIRLYNKLQSLDLGFFHDKQTGDLMSRIVNDTRDFERLYASIIPELITNVVTFVGVLLILLTVNWKLALITCCPIPVIFAAGIFFVKKYAHFSDFPRKAWAN